MRATFDEIDHFLLDVKEGATCTSFLLDKNFKNGHRKDLGIVSQTSRTILMGCTILSEKQFFLVLPCRKCRPHSYPNK